MAASNSFWSIWRIPTVLGLLTVFGLLAALLGTGAWHWASWAALALPLGVIALCLTRSSKRQYP